MYNITLDPHLVEPSDAVRAGVHDHSSGEACSGFSPPLRLETQKALLRATQPQQPASMRMGGTCIHSVYSVTAPQPGPMHSRELQTHPDPWWPNGYAGHARVIPARRAEGICRLRVPDVAYSGSCCPGRGFCHQTMIPLILRFDRNGRMRSTDTCSTSETCTMLGMTAWAQLLAWGPFLQQGH